jgi:predicted ABC-type ATPase
MKKTESPTLLIVGGPNGSGKTTVAYSLREGRDWAYLGADEIAASISPENPLAARIREGYFLQK